jgi:hypothetical protein
VRSTTLLAGVGWAAGVVRSWAPAFVLAVVSITALLTIPHDGPCLVRALTFPGECSVELPTALQVGPVDLVRGFETAQLDGLAAWLGFSSLAVLVAVVGGRRLAHSVTPDVDPTS